MDGREARESGLRPKEWDARQETAAPVTREPVCELGEKATVNAFGGFPAGHFELE